MSKVKPQVIGDEEHERVHDRVTALYVAKDAGVVCTRKPRLSRPARKRGAPPSGPGSPGHASPSLRHLTGPMRCAPSAAG